MRGFIVWSASAVFASIAGCGVGRRVSGAVWRLTVLVGVLAVYPSAAAASVITPPAAVTPPKLTQQTVNAGGGNQADPQLSGDVVAYTNELTSGSEIRYYSLATGADAAIPSSGALDYLPSIDGNTIVYTHRTAGCSTIFSFDVSAGGSPSEVAGPGCPNGVSSSFREAAGIGGSTIAWLDLGPSGSDNPKLVVYDRQTGATTSLTDPSAAQLPYHIGPNVSPDGSVIVWSECPAQCGAYQASINVWEATRSRSGTWTSQQLGVGINDSGNPVTDGKRVYYDCNLGGHATICWQPVGGGEEMQLGLSGENTNPTVSGHLVVFEHKDPTAAVPNYDVYAYDLVTGALYQITNTLYDEILDTVWVDPATHVAHVAWTAVMNDENIYAATFSLETPPSTPGAPTLTTGSSPQNTGAFSLGWGASADPDGDAVSYTLEQKNASGSYSTVASGLISNSYTFGGTNPAAGEGTWSFRVKAVDSNGNASSYAETPALVVVDKTPPSPPTLSPDASTSQSTSFTDASGTTWYKDSELVDVGAKGDPALADGSPGSGVDPGSFPSTVSVATNGTSAVSQTVKDEAGNISSAGTLTAHVDAAPPTVWFTNCPTTPIPVGIPRAVTWTANDGESGLATPSSGSVVLNTAVIGSRTVTTPVASDHVGHTSTGRCSYTVVYNFDGFYLWSNTGWNSVTPGQPVPIAFSLDGPPVLGQSDGFGTNVLQPGSPTINYSVCSTGEPVGATGSASGQLSYVPFLDVYTYVWNPPAQPLALCATLTFTFNDGFSGPGPASAPTTKRIRFQL